MNYLTLLAAIAPIYIAIACGAALRGLGKLRPEADSSLLTVAVNVLYPCLIADVVLGNPALRDTRTMLAAPAVGALTLIAGFALALGVARLIRLPSPQPARTFAFASAIPNWGYLAIPTVQSLFADSKTTLGVLFVHNIGLELTLWSIGIWLLAGARSWRRLFNIPFFAILGSLVISLAGGHEWLPTFARTSLHFLGQAALPLSLILVGATFADQLREKGRASASTTAAGLAVKHLLLPPLMLLAACWLPVSVDLKRIIVVQAAMPTAMVSVILAKQYHGDPGTALRVVIASSIIGLLTVPLWLQLGLRFVGL